MDAIPEWGKITFGAPEQLTSSGFAPPPASQDTPGWPSGRGGAGGFNVANVTFGAPTQPNPSPAPAPGTQNATGGASISTSGGGFSFGGSGNGAFSFGGSGGSDDNATI